jgi:flagellar motor switch protein FliM
MPNILNQDEIDSLLGAMERGGSTSRLERAKGLSRRIQLQAPQTHHQDQLRNFQSIHENFAREMASSIALFLRSQAELPRLHRQQLYSEF